MTFNNLSEEQLEIPVQTRIAELEKANGELRAQIFKCNQEKRRI